jgi:hypothetical protein
MDRMLRRQQMHCTEKDTTMNQTALALKLFTRATLAEARRAELRGEQKYAALLRGSVSEVIEENRPAASPPVDPETAKRLERTRAFAKVIAAGFGQTRR